VADKKEWIEPRLFEGRRILFRNFSGEKSKFNPQGDRTFNVIITQEEADELTREGWNVKSLPPREEDELPTPTLPVRVYYGKRSPVAVLITHRGKTPLDESMIGILDWAEPKQIDMIIRPSHWDVNGKQGIKAYLKAVYFTMQESELDLKYADIPDAPETAASAIMSQQRNPFEEQDEED
jgi:hypothetical protein